MLGCHSSSTRWINQQTKMPEFGRHLNRKSDKISNKDSILNEISYWVVDVHGGDFCPKCDVIHLLREDQQTKMREFK